MSANPKHILILDGNSSHCLPLVRSFQKSGHRVTLICPGVFSCGYFSRYGGTKLIWPRLTDNREEFYQLLMEVLQTGNIDLVMGLSDVSAAFLSIHKREIEKYSSCIVPDYELFQRASDKFLTMKFCMENGIPCPATIDGDAENATGLMEKLKFPVVVKPKTGVGAVGFFILQTREQLSRRLPELKALYGSMLVQEHIPNENQYTVEAFCDQHSVMKACVVANKRRYFPLNGGTSSCIESETHPEITETVKKLLEKIGWQGSANVDLIVDPRDAVPKVIEINPRVGATVKIAHLTGVDIADMTLTMLQKEEISPVYDSTAGIVMRNMMLDLMWFIFSSLDAKRKTKPSFYHLFGKRVHYQNFSMDDPLPFMGYLLGNIMKYADLNILKRKLGFK